MQDTQKPLFANNYLSDVLSAHKQKMITAIDEIDGNRLLNTSVDDLSDYFFQEYQIDAIELQESEITVDQNEIQLDVSQDKGRIIHDRSKPFFSKGTKITYYIPYTGDSQLFRWKPSSYSLNPPKGIVSKNEIQISYNRLDHNADAVKREFGQDFEQLRSYIEWIRKDVVRFNAELPVKIRSQIETRREKVLRDQGLVTSLGFALRKNDHAPQTYVIPSIRRKIPTPLPPASTKPYQLEPTLDMREYDEILCTIFNMVQVLERSPNAFRQLKEEDLRWLFLIPLNGLYEGQATGETFNYEGKTDILVRADNKNIFIGECKFWKGPKNFTDAIDQLIRYSSWRDTKTALLIFNRKGNLSSILGQIPELVKAHPQFKRQLSYTLEAGLRFVLHHADDPNREFIMTVLCFNVPA